MLVAGVATSMADAAAAPPDDGCAHPRTWDPTIVGRQALPSREVLPVLRSAPEMIELPRDSVIQRGSVLNAPAHPSLSRRIWTPKGAA
jgi:hypothetical protein